MRKSEDGIGRGKLLTHPGRPGGVVLVDNTTAHWSLALALGGECPKLDSLRNLIASRSIPVATALKKWERQQADFTKTRVGKFNLNEADCKVCHIDSVGIRKAQPVGEIDIRFLIDHFRLFLSPSNMFVVPKALSGLGELPHFTNAMRGCSSSIQPT